MKLGIFLIGLLTFTAADAAVKDCQFVPREKVESIFSSFQPEVVGLANCRGAFPELNAFYVGKFQSLDDAKVRQFVSSVAKIVDGTATAAAVKWVSKQALEKRQMIVETQSPPNPSRPRADVMSHYSFITKANDGGYLVFVTSLDTESFARSKRSLEASNRLLSGNTRFAASVPN